MKATGMKERRSDFSRHCIKIIAALAFGAVLQTAPSTLAETVVCDATTIAVNATDMKAEELLKAVGEACGIKVMLHGEVFTDDSFSVQFENMPIRTGLERILRVVKLPNHMIHFAETGSSKRVREIDLVGKGGGERQLTSGETPEQVSPRSQPALPPSGQPTNRTSKPGLAKPQEKVIELLDEVMNEQTGAGKEPAPDEAIEIPRQELPEEMQGQIPEDVPPDLEQQPEK